MLRVDSKPYEDSPSLLIQLGEVSATAKQGRGHIATTLKQHEQALNQVIDRALNGPWINQWLHFFP